MENATHNLSECFGYLQKAEHALSLQQVHSGQVVRITSVTLIALQIFIYRKEIASYLTNKAISLKHIVFVAFASITLYSVLGTATQTNQYAGQYIREASAVNAICLVLSTLCLSYISK
ncbi:hypothetical protein K0U07_05540 [bacterium]|nr:hypothetical protein [bacterium]